MPSENRPASGLPFALGAYAIWGLLPLYLWLVQDVPPFEFVGWRIIFTLPVCLLFIAMRRQGAELLCALADRRILLALGLSALLIGGNWLVYIAAIAEGHIYAASLGYYINPLVNVLIGTIFMGERLTRRQWIAVALAGAGVAALFGGALTTLWISLTLALSFALYGTVRKLVPVGAVPGLTIESALLFLPAAGLAAWYAQGPQGFSFGTDWAFSALISLAGVLTAVPLLMFAVAARRMDFSTLGFVQFLSPTLVFIIGLTMFEEPLKPAHLASFIAIWCAIAVFSWDLFARRSEATGKA